MEKAYRRHHSQSSSTHRRRFRCRLRKWFRKNFPTNQKQAEPRAVRRWLHLSESATAGKSDRWRRLGYESARRGQELLRSGRVDWRGSRCAAYGFLLQKFPPGEEGDADEATEEIE